jgi:hypothetical protein
VRRKPLTRRLLELSSWQQLADAFAARQAALSLQLSMKLQRALSRSLCLAASGFADQSQAQGYVSHLLLQTAKDITGLAGQEQQQLAAAAQRADVQLQVRPWLILSSHVTGALLHTLLLPGLVHSSVAGVAGDPCQNCSKCGNFLEIQQPPSSWPAKQ